MLSFCLSAFPYVPNIIWHFPIGALAMWDVMAIHFSADTGLMECTPHLGSVDSAILQALFCGSLIYWWMHECWVLGFNWDYGFIFGYLFLVNIYHIFWIFLIAVFLFCLWTTLGWLSQVMQDMVFKKKENKEIKIEKLALRRELILGWLVG